MGWAHRTLGWLLAACLTGLPVAEASAQSPALQHILRAKRAGCSGFSTNGVTFDLDPANTSTLFQSILGITAVTADGDPVGTAQNAIGGGFDLTAVADTSVRPTYHTAGGKHWLTFTSGENDVLFRTAALGLYSAGAATIVLAVRSTAAVQTSLLGEGRSDSNNGFYFVTRSGSVDFNDLQANYNRDDGTASLASVMIYNEAFPASTDTVIVITDTGSSILAYYDGVPNPAGPTSYTRGTTTPDRFSIGARVRLTTGDYFVGDIYRARVYNRAMSAAEVANETACAKLLQRR